MANMELIETKTVGAGGASSIQFTSIPQTYTDLKVVVSFRGTSAELYEVTALRFNGVNANLSSRTLEGNGSSAGSPNNGYIYFGSGNGANTTANTFSNMEAYIPNYTSSNYKSVSIDAVGENNATTIYMQLTAGLWANTAAITSIEIVPTGNFVQHSTASLYGISKVTSSPKATGGIVSQDADYWYHMFPFTSTFTPTSALTADILCIAGGGAGGGGYGGGGGAGGLRGLTSQSLTTTTYTVTIGAGGAPSTGSYPNGTKGGDGANSSFAGSGFTTISATGGGGGGTWNTAAIGNSGGSGGGGCVGNNGGAGNAGSYSPVEGYAGATSVWSSGSGYNGGGGGAGGAATNQNGGVGTNSYSSWASATFTGNSNYYASGGGAGTNSSGGNTGSASAGGGGNGARFGAGTNGLANTGGGGGGGGEDYSGTGSTGGSGLVIVRYAK